MKIILIILLLLLSGCINQGLLKQIENKQYIKAAENVTKYCAKISDSVELSRESVIATRQIRQQGSNGPLGPYQQIPKLDNKTAYASGPVMMIWCEFDTVPEGVWLRSIKDW